MRDFDARFTAWWSDRNVVDLLTVDTDLIPENGGVYVLGTTSTPLTYPWGTSPVYYIGQSANLRRRFNEHRGYILDRASSVGTRRVPCGLGTSTPLHLGRIVVGTPRQGMTRHRRHWKPN